jgi:ferredoxin
MVNIVVDLDACQGHANCVMVAAEFFSLDDEGKVVVSAAASSSADTDRIVQAIDSCPVNALRLGS